MFKNKIYALVIIAIFIILSFLPVVSSLERKIENNNITVEKWVVLICGGASDSTSLFYADSKPLRKATNHAYDTFKNLGYDDDHIFYLHDRNNTLEGVDGVVNKTMFNYSLNQWLLVNSDENDECCFYFVGHGSKDKSIVVYNYDLEKYERIYDYELAEMIEKINYSKFTIVIDSCHSGGFINSLSKNNRVIITSTSHLLWSYGLNESIFSYHFLNKLVENVSYGKAWEYADKQLLNLETPDISDTPLILRIFIKICISFFENPKIDDNGDGKGHGRLLHADNLPIRKDGNLALETYPR